MLVNAKLGPNLGNSTRVLSGVMAILGKTRWSMMGRAVYCLKSMKVKVISCVEPESFKVIGLADVKFGNFIETRRSVGYCLLTIGCFLVDWFVAKYLRLSDSTAEAEHNELAKLTKSFKFLQMLLSEFNLVDLTCIMFEDNAGAIFLAGNLQVSKRAKHIYLNHHFIREFTEDGNGVQ